MVLMQALDRKQDTEKQLRSDRRVLKRQIMEKNSQIKRLKDYSCELSRGTEKENEGEMQESTTYY